MSKEPVIQLEHVSFSFNGHTVLENVSLTIYERDFLCIVGPNAGGKTTLLKLILGLLKPDRGAVRVFGEPPVKTRARMGYMPQHASLDLLFPVSVMDVVLMGRMGNGKKLLGLRVTDLDGERIGFGRATGRHFGKLFSWLTSGVGFMMAGFTKEKQALHDRLAGCRVCRFVRMPLKD